MYHFCTIKVTGRERKIQRGMVGKRKGGKEEAEEGRKKEGREER